MKKSSFFDEDEDEDEGPAVPTRANSAPQPPDYKALWAEEREKRLDLELLVFELRGEIRQLQEKVKQTEIETAAPPAPTSSSDETAEIGAAKPSVTTPAPAPAHTSAVPKRDLFDSSDSEEGEGSGSGSLQLGLQGGATSSSSSNATSGDKPLSEWEKLALEEKERRTLKARQRQAAQRAAGRGTASRRGSAASTPASAAAAPSTTPSTLSEMSTQDPHLPTPPPSASSAAAPSVAQSQMKPPLPPPSSAPRALDENSSFSSSTFSGSDSDDSGWDDEADSEDWNEDEVGGASTRVSLSGAPAPARARGSSSARPPAALSLFSASSDSHLSAAQIEADVEAAVLAWARGKSVDAMLQTMPQVFFGPLPDTTASNTFLQNPQEVRKAYLRVVRCCHPDKQPADTPPRIRAQAAKVFSALSDAYAAYKNAHGLQ